MTEIGDRKYTANGRNGYTAVDEYVREVKGDSWKCRRLVDTYKVKYVGESVASQLNQAYHDGRIDEENARKYRSKIGRFVGGVEK